MHFSICTQLHLFLIIHSTNNVDFYSIKSILNLCNRILPKSYRNGVAYDKDSLLR